MIKERRRTIAGTFSLAFAITFLLAWLCECAGKHLPQVDLSHYCHITMVGDDFHTRFYMSHIADGLYGEDIWEVLAPGQRSQLKTIGFNETAGIGFRWIRLPDASTRWTFVCNVFYPMAIFAMMGIVLLCGSRNQSRRGFSM